MLRIVQFNLLAPIWISKIYAELPCYADFKSAQRYMKTLKYLRDKLPVASVYCLSEVTLEAVNNLHCTHPYHEGFFVPNDRGYWKEWLAEDIPETIPNGVAILTDPTVIHITKRVDFAYGNGGHAAIIEGIWAHHSVTLRIVSVHLNVKISSATSTSIELDKSADTESISKLLEYLDKQDVVDITLISGDFNTPHITPFLERGYTESVRDPRVNTSPIGSKIDHTLLVLHGFYIQKVKILSEVYQNTDNDSNSIATRFCDTVRFNASDHFATVTTLCM